MSTVTIGTDSTEVFGSVAGGTSFFNLALGGDNWTAATNNNKTKGLVSASRWFTQVGLADPDTGDAIVPLADDSTIPDPVIEATYVLADILLGDVTVADSATTGSNVKIAKAGSAQVEFFRPTEGSVFPDSVMRLISPYLASTVSGSSLVGFNGGSDAESSFCDAESPAVSEGYA